MATKAYTKDDLKRLMQQKKSEAASRRIDSPLAKYDAANQLSCVVCTVKIKNESLWTSHLSSKQHKEVENCLCVISSVRSLGLVGVHSSHYLLLFLALLRLSMR